MAATAQMRAVCPYLIVDDVVRSAEYYRDRLGCAFDHYWGEPPSFVMMRRDGVQIMLKSLERPGHARPNRSVHPEASWDAYVYVADVEALYEEFSRRGAHLLKPPDLADYGVREIEVCDPDGYVLCFGQIVTSGE